MKEIIKNTPGTIAETKRWRDMNPEMPLMHAAYNGKASILIDELNKIGNRGVGMYRWHFDNCKYKK